jgi:hypothetical protein
MFVRFRQNRRRLQCSLIETRRTDGKVRHEHVAGLGAVPIEPSIADRVAFWGALHQRLGKLSNRFSHETHGKLIGQIHARIPMPTVDEQRQLQKANAEADVRHWSAIAEMNSDAAIERMMLSDKARAAAEASLKLCDDSGAKAEAAEERLARIDRGEDVSGGLGKPVTLEQIALAAGWTKAMIRDAKHLYALLTELESRGIEKDYWAALTNRQEKADRRIERQAERDVLRKHGLAWRRPDPQSR